MSLVMKQTTKRPNTMSILDEIIIDTKNILARQGKKKGRGFSKKLSQKPMLLMQF
jgi:hypothetical protein